MSVRLYLFFACLLLAAFSCQQLGKEADTGETDSEKTYQSFQEEVDFLKKHIEILVLQAPSSKGMIALSPALQGRVMTSSSQGATGRSYGWINRALFESGDTLEHINPFGGEERFWLGPEGGQFSIFFKKGDSFTLENWQTPRLIDLEPFEITDQSERQATFTQSARLVNYADYLFELEIERQVTVLTDTEIEASLDLQIPEGVSRIGYRTNNKITNSGTSDWKKESGLLSIWLLGMFNPSDATTIIVPYHPGDEVTLGPIVNDTYFGKVPAERLKIRAQAIYFSGDGKYRSKIGLTPSRAKTVAGSYDAENHILTIVQYSKPEGIPDYVNALWELQDEPYRGDVVNAYNDGPPAPGKKPLGPFYELETSSPAFALKVGESGTHIQQTYHFEGAEDQLNEIAFKVLGVDLLQAKSVL